MKYLLLVLLSLFQWEFMCGPVPRVWDTSDYFRAGSFIFISGEHTCVIPSINATSYSSSSCVVTFSNAMPTVVWGSNIGIVSWDFSLSENIHFNFTSLYSTTMFGFKIFEKIANYIAPIRFRYMVVDDTFYDHFLIMSTVRFTLDGTQSLASLPYSETLYFQLSNTPFDMSHQLVALTFITGANLSSSDINYDLRIIPTIEYPAKLKYVIKSESASMFVHIVQTSIIIFDLTEILETGNYTFYYGSRNAYDSDTFSLEVQPPFYYVNGYFYGLANFTLSPGQNRLQFTSEISPNLTVTTSEIDFKELSFSFWGLRQKRCPSSDLYLDYADMMCYDPCVTGKYGDEQYLCQLCHSYCQACDSYPKCTSCRSEDNRDLESDYCVPKAGFYDDGVLLAVPCSQALCLQCPGDECSQCSQGYFLSDGFPKICESCFLIDQKCVICGQNNSVEIVCSKCQNGYMLNGSNLCEEIKCTDENCIQCQVSVDVCTSCGSGYFVSNKVCVQETNNGGGGDNGNVNNTQCNSECKLSIGFSCQVEGNVSKCYFIGNISIVPISLNKVQGKNRIQVKIDIGAALYNLGIQELGKIIGIQTSGNISDMKIIKNDDGTITLDLGYMNNIQQKQLTFILKPYLLGSQMFSRSNEISKTFVVIADNNKLCYFYEQKYYELGNIISLLCKILVYISLGLFVVGIICSQVVGIEMMAVIQISFFALCSLVNLNHCFSALSSLQLSSGYNMFPNPNQSEKTDLPNQIRVNLVEHFIYNVNFTLLLLIVTLFIGFVFFILSKLYKNPQKCRKFELLCYKFVYQYTFTVVAFCSYLISISFIIQMRYGLKNMNFQLFPLSLAIGTFIVIITIFYMIVLLMNPKLFGQFCSIFKKGKYNQRIYVVLIFERWIISTCLVIAINSKVSVVAGIASSVVLLVGCFVTKAHRETEHTYRFCGNMLITLIILGIYLFYNLSDNQTKSRPINLYLPVVVIVLLFVCIIYSGYFIIKDLILILQGKKGSYFLGDISQDKIKFDEDLEQNFKNMNQSFYIQSQRINRSFLPQFSGTSKDVNLLKQYGQQDIRSNNERMKKIKQDLKLQFCNPKISPLKAPIVEYQNVESFCLQNNGNQSI